MNDVTKVLGIHHVTAIASDPQRNLDFYGAILGLRFVKRTVNFDDPDTYHFYFGDEVGTPGSIMTFFPWPGAHRGRIGPPQVATTSFAIVPRALAFWSERLLRHGIKYQGPTRRGQGSDAEQVISFEDRDGLKLEIVAHAGAEARTGWSGAPGISGDESIRAFHGVTLFVDDGEPTERVLVDTLGFRGTGEDDNIHHFAAGDGGPGTRVSVRSVGGFPEGVEGAGTVHHIAFRVADDAEQLVVRDQVVAAGLHATPVIDRNYFHSVYFREPNGVLFELATDPPGFAIDEPLAELGEHLKLPPRLEPDRARIEAVLPEIQMPSDPVGTSFFTTNGGKSEVSVDSLGFIHRFVPGTSETTLLVLHSTGGDEEELIPLARELDSRAALLAPRGKVSERGANRFFRRLAEGVFDLDDLRLRTDELAEFVRSATTTYALRGDDIVGLGFSNGANIAVSLLLRHPGLLAKAVLLSPMLGYDPGPLPDLRNTSVFIGAGQHDPLVPVAQVEGLAAVLRAAGAGVTVFWTPAGHEITPGEIQAAKAWLSE